MKIVIAIPAYNEQAMLAASIASLVSFCQANVSIEWQIIIADNNSTDDTKAIGQALATKYPAVEYMFVSRRGKGAAIKAAWQRYQADVYCFMDADLATDLSALPAALKEIAAGNNIVVGSRIHPQSHVERSLFRRLVSRGYLALLRGMLHTHSTDAPCGFKVITQSVKQAVLPRVVNDEWFFDSELLVLAEVAGYRIKEIPVRWADPREGKDKSRVRVVSLSWAYFTKVLALRKRLKNG